MRSGARYIRKYWLRFLCQSLSRAIRARNKGNRVQMCQRKDSTAELIGAADGAYHIVIICSSGSDKHLFRFNHKEICLQRLLVRYRLIS